MTQRLPALPSDRKDMNQQTGHYTLQMPWAFPISKRQAPIFTPTRFFIRQPQQHFAVTTLRAGAVAAAIEEKPGGRFMIRHRIRVVKRHPEGDW
jgi:hypothetical protein